MTAVSLWNGTYVARCLVSTTAARPPVTFPANASTPAATSSHQGGHRDSRYIDGGYRANENADLAAGYGRVLVLSPLGGRSRAPLDWAMHLAAPAGELRARGNR